MSDLIQLVLIHLREPVQHVPSPLMLVGDQRHVLSQFIPLALVQGILQTPRTQADTARS